VVNGFGKMELGDEWKDRKEWEVLGKNRAEV